MALKEVLAIFSLQVAGKQQIDQADKSVSKLEGAVKTLGAALAAGVFAKATTGLFSWVTGIADATDATAKFADALGVNTRDIAEWDQILGNAGVALQEGRNGIRTFAKQAGNAAQGNKGLQKTFRELGVSFKNSDGSLRPLNDRLTDSVLGLAKIEDSAKRAAAAEKLFGKAGLGFVRVALDGADALKAQREEFEDLLGGGSYDQFVQDSRDAAIAGDRMRNALGALRVGIAKALIPVVTKITVGIAKFVKGLTRLIKGTKIVQTTLVLLGVVAAAVAAKILISFAPLIFTVLAIVAAIAAVILIVEDLFVLFTGGESLIGRFIDKLFGIGAATKVVDAVKSAFQSLIGVVEFFGDVGSTIFDAYTAAVRGTEIAIEAVVKFIEKAIERVKEFIDEVVSISKKVQAFVSPVTLIKKRFEKEQTPSVFEPAIPIRTRLQQIPNTLQVPTGQILARASARTTNVILNPGQTTINVTGDSPEEIARLVLEQQDRLDQERMRRVREEIEAR